MHILVSRLPYDNSGILPLISEYMNLVALEDRLQRRRIPESVFELFQNVEFPRGRWRLDLECQLLLIIFHIGCSVDIGEAAAT